MLGSLLATVTGGGGGGGHTHHNGMTRERVKEMLQITSIKRKMPEDLAANDMIRTILIGLREHGHMNSLFRSSGTGPNVGV